MRLIDADRLIEELESYKECYIGTPVQVDRHNNMIDYAISVLEDAYPVVRSCMTCRFSCERFTFEVDKEHFHELYGCLNTEICLESNQTKNFYCSKWEEKVNV